MSGQWPTNTRNKIEVEHCVCDKHNDAAAKWRSSSPGVATTAGGQMTAPEAVLCIPGPWADRSELVERIVRASEGYLFVGNVIMHLETKDKFELQFEGADPRMVAAFASAGQHWAATEAMDRIAAHASVVYLIGECGALANAERLMLAGDGVLKAGGAGIKVESCGLAHSPNRWAEFVADRHLFSAHDAYVVYVRGAQVYSCGMHHFGLPEAVVDQVDAEDPAELLRVFTRYLLCEGSTIVPGQTFAVAADAPGYRIVPGEAIDYAPDSLFHNPYGMWRLEALDRGTLTRKSAWWRRWVH